MVTSPGSLLTVYLSRRIVEIRTCMKSGVEMQAERGAGKPLAHDWSRGVEMDVQSQIQDGRRSLTVFESRSACDWCLEVSRLEIWRHIQVFDSL